jgi:hypothetical protein
MLAELKKVPGMVVSGTKVDMVNRWEQHLLSLQGRVRVLLVLCVSRTA